MPDSSTRPPRVAAYPDRFATTLHLKHPFLDEADVEFEGYPPPAAPCAGRPLTLIELERDR